MMEDLAGWSKVKKWERMDSEYANSHLLPKCRVLPWVRYINLFYMSTTLYSQSD